MITFKAKTENGVLVRSTFEQFSFPAGETHLRTDPTIGVRPTEIAIAQFSPESLHTDLFTLQMWGSVLDDGPNYNTKRILILPYLPGARADRGLPFGAEIYAKAVAAIEPDVLLSFDPHSETWLNEFYTHSPYTTGVALGPAALSQIFEGSDYDGIIAPDKGAVERAAGMANKLDLTLYVAGKERDFSTGKLTKFVVPEDLPMEGKFLIVDDICDGGGTFAGLATAIAAERKPKEVGTYSGTFSMDLFVSHGIFSGSALDTLPGIFKTVYTTNSFLNHRHNDMPEGVAVIDVIKFILGKI